MSFGIEFGTKAAADAAREDYEEFVCPLDDDKRQKTVHFVSDTPDGVREAIEADAMDSRGDRVRSNTADLTAEERDRISGLGGFQGRPTTFNWESAKGVFAREGLLDQFHDAMGSLTDYDDPAEGAEQWVRDYQEGGGGGGRRDHGEEDVREQQRAADAARTAQGEGCDHARDYCENGDPAACEHLQDVCGYSEDEVSMILGDDRDTSTTEQRELVTVGGGEFPKMDVTPQVAGALHRSWQGYRAGVGELDRLLGEVRSAVIDARQAMRAINRIREEHGQDALHPDRLHDLLEALRMMPESIPEVRTLDHYGDTEDEPGERPQLVDDRGQPDGDSGLYQYAENAPEASDGPSREHRAAQNDGYLRTGESQPVENERQGLGEYGARTSDTKGLEEFEDTDS